MERVSRQKSSTSTLRSSDDFGKRWMPGDPSHRPLEQCFSRCNSVPGGCARRMGQRNKIKSPARAFHSKTSSNYLFKPRKRNKLSDSKFPHRKNKNRSQQFQFTVQPGRTIANFIGSGNPITAAGSFSRKTAADSGKINRGTDHGFIQFTKLFKPSGKRPTSSVCKWALQYRFADARRLTDKD